MPIVKVELVKGRPPALKAKVAKEITDVITKNLNVPGDQTFVVFNEVERHDWAIDGRTLDAPK